MRHLALLVCAATTAYAQSATSSIVGRVSDPSGAPLAGALIQVEDSSTGLRRTAVTAASGDYTIAPLAPGIYQLTAEADGFRTARRDDIVVALRQVARLDIRLELAALTQSVDVTTAPPLLNTDTSGRGEIVTNAEIMNMPLEGRNMEDLALLVPGTAAKAEGSLGSIMSVNGARADSTGFVLDGFANRTPRDGFAQASAPLDAVQEFRMETSGFSAEYGRQAGGIMSVVLKSGGNRFRGSLYDYARNDFLDARNYFSVAKPKLRRHQFGGTLNGPIRRDRTFFVFSWEGTREKQGSTRLTRVPTELERKGDFSQTIEVTGRTIALRDPLSNAQFPGNRIPAARWMPQAQRLLEYYPAPNWSGGANNFLSYGNAQNDLDNILIKFDQRLRGGDNLSFRFLRKSSYNVSPYEGGDLGTFGSFRDEPQMLAGLTHSWVITPAWMHEFRAGLARTTRLEQGLHVGRDFASQFGIPGTTTEPSLVGFPRITFRDLAPMGDAPGHPARYTVNNFNFASVLSWMKSGHSMKIGIDVLRTQYMQPYTTSNARGTLAFQGLWTNSAFGDFLLGMLNTSTRQVGSNPSYTFNTSLGAFVQDDWRIRRDLTLNLGLRYEILEPPYEKYGRMGNFVPGPNQIVLSNDRTVSDLSSVLAPAQLSGKVTTAREAGLPRALVRTQYANFAPRVGFAWRPRGNNQTVVRSAFGIFHAANDLSFVRNEFGRIYPFVIAESFNRVPADPEALTLAQPFPAALRRIGGTTTAYGYEVDAPQSYLQSWNFTLERVLAREMTIEVAYAGSKGTHLGRRYDLNPQLRFPGLQLPNGTFPRPYSVFNTINYYAFGSNSNYHAGTVTLRRRLSKGAFYRLNYTWSKSIDDASQSISSGNGGVSGAQDVFNLRAERGRSEWDARHIATFNLSWDIPGKRRWLLRGWQIAGTGRVMSGQPITPRISGANAGEPTRPDRIRQGSLNRPSPERWFDVGAFAVVPPAELRFGNSGRSILDGPGLIALSSSLSRSFRFEKRGAVQLRWEVFNVTNHTNFNLPVVNVNVVNAASITRARAARVMQLAVRYQF
jgi:hypothetical protein